MSDMPEFERLARLAAIEGEIAKRLRDRCQHLDALEKVEAGTTMTGDKEGSK